ncbi:hypothetical protein KJ644_03270 [Candidatus Dependentiae bacterium]|nr:hypothetical protein [Candidatus Dependentiae bacterium]MBU4387467.1 hypothetical protein [Candidatus Dependentiae bacterium]MCG2756152.1 clostripain-related cysteine peptidase [Candidatus Dependentiae bacterium]
MSIKSRLFIALFLSITSFNHIFSIADWTILIYVQAKNNLSRFATQNLYSMAKIGSNNNLNILVQWYQPGKDGVWRYQILKDEIKLDTYLPINSDGTNVKDLVDSMEWAVNKYPAKNNFLILWNHGVGIIDPIWHRRSGFGLGYGLGLSGQEFNEVVINNQNIVENQVINSNDQEQFFPIKIDDELTQAFNNSQDFDYLTLNQHRGILFNEQSRSYLNNEELLEALKQIKENVLKGKQLDIFGMDACLMSMIEIGYLARGYAKYMVSSQEVELAYGWNYLDLFTAISSGTTTPIDMAKGCVLTYHNFYQNKIDFYTQSAVDLDQLDNVKTSINNIILKINEAKKISLSQVKNFIKYARRASTQFTNKSYIDLYSFYFELIKQVDGNLCLTSNQLFKNSLLNLKSELLIGMKSIENAVVAKTSGKKFANTCGLSIYFPTGSVEQSYLQTSFVKDSLWLDLIKDAFV